MDEKTLEFVGCTANVCYLENETGKAYVANLGDSRAVYCRSHPEGGASDIIPLSVDHKPNDPAEKKRIEGAHFTAVDVGNGSHRVYNPNELVMKGGLNISRTIGDFYYKRNLQTRSSNSAEFALSNICDIKEVQFFDHSGKENEAGSLEFLLLGCDGIWEGGDFHDKKDKKKV